MKHGHLTILLQRHPWTAGEHARFWWSSSPERLSELTWICELPAALRVRKAVGFWAPETRACYHQQEHAPPMPTHQRRHLNNEACSVQSMNKYQRSHSGVKATHSGIPLLTSFHKATLVWDSLLLCPFPDSYAAKVHKDSGTKCHIYKNPWYVFQRTGLYEGFQHFESELGFQ